MDIKIIVATHKEFWMPQDGIYLPIQVGAAREGHARLPYRHDDEGDNISAKNANYCELTGLYWIWKNTDDEYKGLAHYRRYFCCSFSKNEVVTQKQIINKLKKYDVILPFACKLPNTVAEHYCELSGFERDLCELEKVIGEKYPEYIPAYHSVMNGNTIHFYNMLIAKREVFDAYCKWLFDILFELENRVDLTDYSDYQKRIFGFMSERLLNVFFTHNNYNVFEMGVVQPEDKHGAIKEMLMAFKRVLLFRL